MAIPIMYLSHHRKAQTLAAQAKATAAALTSQGSEPGSFWVSS
jgi:hypothetical protein